MNLKKHLKIKEKMKMGSNPVQVIIKMKYPILSGFILYKNKYYSHNIREESE